MNHSELCDCPECETPVPVRINDQFTNRVGIWTVIKFDHSGQGAVLRGPSGQIRCEPLNEYGALLNRF